MYQALYRKYRPKTFDEIYGQDIIIKILKNSITNNQISHAYLFSGPRGTGKTSIAKIFANTINCKNNKNTKPCGVCDVCTQTNNIDIIEIDAASNNGIDEIREIRDKVGLVPSISKYKVYIIDEIHMLTIGAFNALLKTLEEPPQHVIFILATTEVYKIPTTILSRCQRFDFKKINEKAIYSRLKEIIDKENIKINDDAIKEISRISDGGLRDAISILDQVIAYSDENITSEDIHNINGTITQHELKKLIESIINKDLKNTLNTISDYDDNGKNLVKITEEIILFLKNIMLSKNSIEILENNDIYSAFNDKIENDNLYSYIIELNSTLIQMKKSNNPHLLLELLLIRFIGNKSVEKTQKQPEKIKNETVMKENTKKTVNEISTKKQKQLDKLKLIRINNTLTSLKKKLIGELKLEIEKMREEMLISSMGEYISILLDGELKAANEENLIFVYEKDVISNQFNENLPKIERLFVEYLNKNYKAISVTKEEWNKIRAEYNSKTKEYKYVDEKNLEKEIFEKESTELDNMFGDIVEYS